MTFQVFDFLALDQPIQVMDVGASAIAETPIYKPLLDKGWAHLHAFDGDARQIERIKAAYGDRATVHADFLFDGSARTLHLCDAAGGMTSLLKPRPDALAFFNGFAQFGRVESTLRVETRRLDDLAEPRRIDFLKMDTQGAELTVLRNGAGKLATCVAVQLEMPFFCLYEDQPSFGDIDAWMRGQGFVPHGFVALKRWPIAPTIFNGDYRRAGNQLLEADLIYVKDPLKLEILTGAQLATLATLAHHAFNSFDLCAYLLLELESRGLIPQDAPQRYLGGLGK
ncbi:MAG: FkbM family methyltransferase [Alphaproteobacteria bacterium]|nr:FkbM family methyltransferase [Alphaproteobacteria bacterium]